MINVQYKNKKGMPKTLSNFKLQHIIKPTKTNDFDLWYRMFFNLFLKAGADL